MAMSSTPGSSGNFPIDNLTYDLIILLHEKSQGLEAFDKYLRDAQGDQECSQLFQQLRQQNEQAVQQLHQQLIRVIGTQGGMNREFGGSTTDSQR